MLYYIKMAQRSDGLLLGIVSLRSTNTHVAMSQLLDAKQWRMQDLVHRAQLGCWFIVLTKFNLLARRHGTVIDRRILKNELAAFEAFRSLLVAPL